MNLEFFTYCSFSHVRCMIDFLISLGPFHTFTEIQTKALNPTLCASYFYDVCNSGSNNPKPSYDYWIVKLSEQGTIKCGNRSRNNIL